MDDLVLVRHVHRTGEHLDDAGGLVDRLGLAANLLREVAAGKEFEREVWHTVVFANLEDLDDVGVFDRGDRFRLGLEPDEVLGPRARPGTDHLQSDEPVEPWLPRLVDDPHPTRTQHLHNLVTGDVRPCVDRRVC